MSEIQTTPKGHTIGNTTYTDPVMSFAASSHDRAQMVLDAISYRMGFLAGNSTMRLDTLHEDTDGTWYFAHPITQGPTDDAAWLDKVLEGVTSYTVKERPEAPDTTI